MQISLLQLHISLFTSICIQTTQCSGKTEPSHKKKEITKKGWDANKSGEFFLASRHQYGINSIHEKSPPKEMNEVLRIPGDGAMLKYLKEETRLFFWHFHVQLWLQWFVIATDYKNKVDLLFLGFFSFFSIKLSLYSFWCSFCKTLWFNY